MKKRQGTIATPTTSPPSGRSHGPTGLDLIRSPRSAAAIDRLVHHSVIIELNVPSYRVEKAKSKGKPTTGEAPATSS